MKRLTHEMRLSLFLWLALFFIGFLGKSNLPEPEIKITTFYEKDDSIKTPLSEEQKSVEDWVQFQTYTKNMKKINLNTCDTNELKMLHINSRWANKIIEFRKALGGYYHINQLMDIYGFPEFFFEKLYYEGTVAPDEVIALGINNKTEIELMLHPYLSKKNCQAIVNYRKEHGHFKTIEELYQIKTIDSLTIKKIEPYLAKEFKQK
jgi:competence protein ComEA